MGLGHVVHYVYVRRREIMPDNAIVIILLATLSRTNYDRPSSTARLNLDSDHSSTLETSTLLSERQQRQQLQHVTHIGEHLFHREWPCSTNRSHFPCP
jgi:hypothetical protein